MIPNNKVAETFHDLFVQIGPILKCFPKDNQELETGNDNKLVLNYINSFKKNSSLKFIKQRKTEEQHFTLNYVSYKAGVGEISKLKSATKIQ